MLGRMTATAGFTAALAVALALLYRGAEADGVGIVADDDAVPAADAVPAVAALPDCEDRAQEYALRTCTHTCTCPAPSPRGVARRWQVRLLGGIR